MENILFAMRNIVESVQEFVVKNRDKNYKVSHIQTTVI